MVDSSKVNEQEKNNNYLKCLKVASNFTQHYLKDKIHKSNQLVPAVNPIGLDFEQKIEQIKKVMESRLLIIIYRVV